MPQNDFYRQHGTKIGVALLLTFTSGVVDIVGYLGIFQLFTAHLTGTTVQLGSSLVQREWTKVFAAVMILAAFFGGSVFGRTLIEIGGRRRFPKIATVTLAIESFVLAIVAVGTPNVTRAPHAGLILLAGAMGIQTATLTRIGPLTVHTTFVTGMVNKLAQLVSHIAFRAYDARRANRRSRDNWEQRRDIEMTWFLLGIWLCYLAGAAFGAWAFVSWAVHSLVVAILLLGVCVGMDQFQPLSVTEEQEQAEN
jgi:uncharacterized membrane protein YoaK (UPF0700 family)